MKTNTMQPHQGRNVKRLREMLGIKQDALAIDLGLSQQTVSQLEQKEELDAVMLRKIAEILKVPEEAIKNFNDEAVVNIISNTFSDNAAAHATFGAQYNFNPIDKWLEAIEENKKLYERLLESEREKVELIEKMIEKVKA